MGSNGMIRFGVEQGISVKGMNLWSLLGRPGELDRKHLFALGSLGPSFIGDLCVWVHVGKWHPSHRLGGVSAVKIPWKHFCVKL